MCPICRTRGRNHREGVEGGGDRGSFSQSNFGRELCCHGLAGGQIGRDDMRGGERMLKPNELNQDYMEHRLCYAIGYLRGELDTVPQQYSSCEVLEILEAIEKSAGAGTPSGR